MTGAYQEAVTEYVKHLPVQIIHNPDWQSGMASSIKKGLEGINQKAIEDTKQKVIEDSNKISKIILTVCDQPYISAALFQSLNQNEK